MSTQMLKEVEKKLTKRPFSRGQKLPIHFDKSIKYPFYMPKCMFLTHIQHGVERTKQACAQCSKAEKCIMVTNENFFANCMFVLNGHSNKVYSTCKQCTQHKKCPAIKSMRTEQVAARLAIQHTRELKMLNAPTHDAQPYVFSNVWVRAESPVVPGSTQYLAFVNTWQPVPHKTLDAVKVRTPTDEQLAISKQQDSMRVDKYALSPDVTLGIKTPLNNAVFNNWPDRPIAANNFVHKRKCTRAFGGCDVCVQLGFVCCGRKR
jgi:hypothetical protein